MSVTTIEETGTELAPAELNPLVLIDRAIQSGMDPDRLGKLFDLAERFEKNESAKRFADAVTGFQAECLPVFKSRTASGKFAFKFASYDDIMATAAPLLGRYRIVPSFTTDQLEGKAIKVTCRIRVGTHVEETTITVPIPAGVVNDTQLMGQAVAYGKRYAICAALNIVCTDDDTDAAGLTECINADQCEQLNDLIRATGTDIDRFLSWCECKSLEAVPAKKFPIAVDMLKRKKRPT